jgi:hypothetical protein
MYKDRERERMDQGSASHLLYDSLKRLGGLIEGGPGLKSPPLVEHPFRIGPHHPPGLVLVRPWTERGGGCSEIRLVSPSAEHASRPSLRLDLQQMYFNSPAAR